MALNGVFEVLVGRELRVCGLIGPALPLNKKGPSVSEVEIDCWYDGLEDLWIDATYYARCLL